MNTSCWFLDVLKKHGERITTEDGTTYYHLPHWFSECEGTAVMHTKMPEDLGLAITHMGLGRPYPPDVPLTTEIQ